MQPRDLPARLFVQRIRRRREPWMKLQPSSPPLRTRRPIVPPSGGRSRACDAKSIVCSRISSWAPGARRSGAARSMFNRSGGATSGAERRPSTSSIRRTPTSYRRSCPAWTRTNRRQILRRHLDHQGREARRTGGEEEKLLFGGAPLWVLPAFVQRPEERRRGSDRGEFQERRADGHVAEDAASTPEREEDPGQAGLRSVPR